MKPGTWPESMRRAFLLPVWLAPLLGLALAAGCAKQQVKKEVPASVGEVLPGFLQGYLAVGALPASINLLPPPPAPQSAAFAADEEAYRNSRRPPGSPRFEQAAKDAELRFPKAAESFSCALNAPIGPESSPHLTMLMRRSMTDSGLSTYSAKDHYERVRPFVVYKEATCTPQEENFLRTDGSYPSGHSTIGWTWALMLAELAPERSDALIARGLSFGQSRVICGVHWQSDVTAGRVMGAATLARLHGDPTFKAEMELARKELTTAWDSGRAPTRDCRAEAEALR
jgi:acid phosphatase (class A)